VHESGKDRDPMGSAMGWEWDRNGIKVCGKWELRRGSGKKSVHTVTSKHLQKALIALNSFRML